MRHWNYEVKREIKLRFQSIFIQAKNRRLQKYSKYSSRSEEANGISRNEK